jgi:hypothetical protein
MQGAAPTDGSFVCLILHQRDCKSNQHGMVAALHALDMFAEGPCTWLPCFWLQGLDPSTEQGSDRDPKQNRPAYNMYLDQVTDAELHKLGLTREQLELTRFCEGNMQVGQCHVKACLMCLL